MNQTVRIQRSRAPNQLPTKQPMAAFSDAAAPRAVPAGTDDASVPPVAFNIGNIDILPRDETSDRGLWESDASADGTAGHLQSLLRRSTAARGATEINQVLGRAIVGSMGQFQGGSQADSHLLQAKAGIGLTGGPVGADLQTRIDANRGQGKTLDDDTRGAMEGAFGHDFSRVRIHADGEAQELNDRVGARAFTTGSDIFFRQGEYAPQSPNGQELLAHELTHVVQQGGMHSGGEMEVGPAGDTYEREADAAGAAVVSMIENMPASATLDTTVAPVPVVSIASGLGAGTGVVQRADDASLAGNQQDDDQYEEVVEDFQPEEGDETEQDLIALYVPDIVPDLDGGGKQDQAVAAPPAIRFIDEGRIGTARYGDLPGPGYGVFPHAFTDAGQTATTKWAGGGGAGAHGNEAVGSLQKHVPPVFFQVAKKADAWVKENTGQIDVRRSWTGINAGDQGNGHFVTAAAAARINLHETQHVNNTSSHYTADLDPLLARVADRTMDIVVAKSLLPPATPRAIAALKADIKWGPTVGHFQSGDKADNKPMGAVDVADLASGTYPVDVGPGIVAGKAFQHRLRTPSEPTPAS